MSASCVRGKIECDGCMSCEVEPCVIGECAACHEDIRADEDYYDIEGEIVHEECLSDWAEKYRVRG